ncbi:MAG: rhomboid family intramembrane serine protease [Arcobacteraceae bacterium]|nr:rhomboid family intramembrane serine protease [Arcobacteraceae bacterium]
MNKHQEIFTLTNIIILITILSYFIQTNIPYGDILFGLNIYFFTNELYYQLLSTMFAHGGVEHLAMNMIVLWQMGNLLEGYIGKFRFFLIYFIGGILTSIGTLAYMYFTEDFVNVVGASGAISVIMGYYALKVPDERKGIFVWIVLISFVPILFGMPVAWYSHLIGFVIGFLTGFIL